MEEPADRALRVRIRSVSMHLAGFGTGSEVLLRGHTVPLVFGATRKFFSGGSQDDRFSSIYLAAGKTHGGVESLVFSRAASFAGRGPGTAVPRAGTDDAVGGRDCCFKLCRLSMALVSPVHKSRGRLVLATRHPLLLWLRAGLGVAACGGCGRLAAGLNDHDVKCGQG